MRARVKGEELGGKWRGNERVGRGCGRERVNGGGWERSRCVFQESYEGFSRVGGTFASRVSNVLCLNSLMAEKEWLWDLY